MATLNRVALAIVFAYALVAANTALAFPEALPPSPRVSAPLTIDLPNNTTVDSIIKKIIQHGDLRDTVYISQLFSISQKEKDGFWYDVRIKNTRPQAVINVFYLAPSPATEGDENFSGSIGYISFGNVPLSSCIRFSDFNNLSDIKVDKKPVMIQAKAYYVLHKKLDQKFSLSFRVPATGACANSIRIEMDKKSLPIYKGE